MELKSMVTATILRRELPTSGKENWILKQEENEQEGSTEAGKRVQGKGKELHKNSKGEGGEGIAVFVQRSAQQEA